MCCKNGKKPGPQCPCALGLEGCHCKKLLLLKKTMKVSELFTTATPAWRGKRSSPHPAAPNATHRHKLPSPAGLLLHIRGLPRHPRPPEQG